jgi:hypothetical protein
MSARTGWAIVNVPPGERPSVKLGVCRGLSLRTYARVNLVSTDRGRTSWTREQALEEIERLLRDTERHADANGGHWGAALGAAEVDAIKRAMSCPDEAQADAIDFACLVAGWVFERADLPDERASYEAASRAVRDAPESNWLTADLYRLIDSYLDGSLTREGFGRMLNKPLLGRPRRQLPPPPPGDFPFDTAEATLRAMLKAASVDPQSDAPAAFGVLVAFAKLDAGANAEYLVEDDSCCCEYSTSAKRFVVEFRRQFSLADRDGDYSHMQQLSLTFEFPAQEGDDGGVVWANENIDAWVSRLRATSALRAIMTRKPTSATVRVSDV